jgi:predicted glycoside hydrolase/deacetylase ChbG (UPF0249 family)
MAHTEIATLVRSLPWIALGPVVAGVLGWRLGRGKIRFATNGPLLRSAAAAARRIADTICGGREQALNERLGFDSKARLLIVHADDLGIAQSVNAAFFQGFAAGLINSGSAIVPSPWFSEIAAFSRSHPDADIGLHLTLTSEKGGKCWPSVAPPAQVSSLVDPKGCLPQAWTADTCSHATQIEIELRAQIEKAYASGLRPTHLDSHQFRLQWSNASLFEIYLRLSRQYRLPVLVSREWFAKFPYLKSLARRHDIVLDRIVVIRNDVRPEDWPRFYRRQLESLPAGVTAILMHPGHDDEELRSCFAERASYGAAWRKRDLDFFTSEECRALLTEQEIKLITWREIMHRLGRGNA